jgi:glycosyltransferase involved in cell wall biosynthesis
MIGASNKPFDYMAAGLALLVSDLPEWREMFVNRGYGRACDPHDKAAILEALSWYLQHPEEREVIGKRNQAAISNELNYELGFKPIVEGLNMLVPQTP